jgi:hypothetical protein
MSRGNQREADRAKNQAKLAAKQKAAVKVCVFVLCLWLVVCLVGSEKRRDFADGSRIKNASPLSHTACQ